MSPDTPRSAPSGGEPDQLTGRSSVRSAGRPRSDDLESRLLGTTQQLLAEQGYDQLSLEGVSQAAGAGRPSLYRRWPNKAALVFDAIRALRWDRPAPDTGNLRDDLVALWEVWEEPNATRDQIMAGIIPALRQLPDLRAAVDDAITRPRTAAFTAIIHRAHERGETDMSHVDLIATIVPALMIHRIGITGSPISPEYIQRIIDEIMLPLITAPRA